MEEEPEREGEIDGVNSQEETGRVGEEGLALTKGGPHFPGLAGRKVTRGTCSDCKDGSEGD